MNFNEYQEAAVSTAIYKDKYYPFLGLAGETGEVCEKTKKLIRDGNGEPTESYLKDIQKELGDVLWYVANIAHDLGIDLDEVAKTNIEKLKSRQERGVLGGSGDNR
jgi:NTP pyrophosphatase (non-canonical NTP hydrolase)